MKTISWDKEFAFQKLNSAISTIEAIIDGEWPYDDPRDAILIVLDDIKQVLTSLNELDIDASEEIIRRKCRVAHDTIADTIAFLGFVLRSTNLRNAFEIYTPLRMLGKQILGDHIKFVISSEWNYVPFVYPIPKKALSEFVFVGLPATESENALLVPIAGHELGHAVWRRNEFGSRFRRDIHIKIIEIVRENWNKYKIIFGKKTNQSNFDRDIISLDVITKINNNSMRQLEEVFCDIIGLAIFGVSYTYAFSYVLGPDSKTRIAPIYPPNLKRAKYIIEAAEILNIKIPNEFQGIFRNLGETKDAQLIISDEVTESFVSSVIKLVHTFVLERNLISPTEEGKNRSFDCLTKLRPVEGENCIADIINAAWEIRFDLANWKVPGVLENKKIHVLNDLVLKSFEVVEWNVVGKGQHDGSQ
jgi:hypothetical protein